MTKDLKIEIAYGEHWKNFNVSAKNCALNSDGWIGSILEHAPKDIEMDFHEMSFRPIVLQGIENNNGWIKVLDKENMPYSDCNCFIIDKNGVSTGKWKQAPNEEDDEKARLFWLSRVTHYKIIDTPELPLY